MHEVAGQFLAGMVTDKFEMQNTTYLIASIVIKQVGVHRRLLRDVC
jgi:hypothetical protein